MTLWHLCLAFLRVGLLGYGGGPSSIPLVHKEVVDKYGWMTDDEFGDVLALGNALPGPIATKMAGYIGWRIAGFFGMLVALFATIVPTIILMVILLTFLLTFQDKGWVKGMTHAVVPVVAVMLATLTWQFFSKAKEGLGWWKAIVLVVISVVLMEGVGLHPAIVILALLVYVLVMPNKTQQSEVKRGKSIDG
ncbi:chromate transporter [Pullulanibacillus pueri]|uniref:Putative transporter YwrA n=1 Tax=Pullulanibacillus pueri TaxID=1437324 RepID=A0A8J2ZWS2_9BACL|nr:chromate transporter [Pullulanibacillus pueri]MBM7681752.1 chromate transporter [Pullulanibacillus pueri]GGH84140.1 putative transporter YwrA [Pullulanibacillus pueri]